MFSGSRTLGRQADLMQFEVLFIYTVIDVL